MIDFRAAFFVRVFSSTHFFFWPFLTCFYSLMLCFVYNIFRTELSEPDSDPSRAPSPESSPESRA